jgi:M6 family metalloprotease-like protein
VIKIIITLTLLFFLSGCYAKQETTSQKDNQSNQIIPKDSVAMVGILVNYNNQKINANDKLWSDKLFGFKDGELNSYYMQTSTNNFQFKKVSENNGDINDGIISISLEENHPNIDVDNSFFAETTYSDLKKSLQKADKYIDFSNYDTDANGYITPNELIIVFIIAGYEDAYEGYHVRNGIWGHQNCMDNTTNTAILDGVSLMGCSHNGNFALFGEQHNKSKPHTATIGIIAHELGHATFNLPDLYNTVQSNSGGIGYFGIMGSGTWGSKSTTEYAGQTPTHFSAWSKIYNGWITPSIQKSAVTLYATSSLEYNIIKIPINKTSYYLLENRDNSGYDRGLHSLNGIFQGGMALWKIDESKITPKHIQDNTVNADTLHKGIDLVEAVNGNIDKGGDGGNQNALFYDKNINHFLNIITNVSQRGSTMNLNIN